MNTFWRPLMLFVLVGVLAMAVVAQGRGPGKGQHGQGDCTVANAKAITVQGAIDTVTLPAAGTSQGPAQITVKAKNAATVVHLGPAHYLTQVGYTPAKGQQVTVAGWQVTLDGKPVVVARTVTTGNKAYTFRTEQGKPAWMAQAQGHGMHGGKGQGMRQGQGCAMGAGRGQGKGQCGGQMCQGVDTAKSVTLDGVVSALTIPEAGTQQGPVRFTLEKAQVFAGPQFALQQVGLALKNGQQVQVAGWTVTLDGKETVIARTITVEGKTYTLRDEQGKPVWAGQGKGQGKGQGQGQRKGQCGKGA